MRDALLPYYEGELRFIRQMAGEFAKKYPRIAGRLQLEEDKCEDPHVERLIEAFALLAARVHHKIDDEYPEIIQSLLDLLYPHFLRPVPSMAVVQFEPDPEQSSLSEGFPIERHSRLLTRTAQGQPCRYRTCYPVTVWPLEVVSAEYVPAARLPLAVSGGDAFAAIRIGMRCLGDLTVQVLGIDRLRLFLSGDSQLVNTLYELVFSRTMRVVIRDQGADGQGGQDVLAAAAVEEAGFGVDEGMVPYSDRSFLGYRLLQEYFSFPDKFLFLDLVGLHRLHAAGRKKEFDIFLVLDKFERIERVARLEAEIDKDVFRLGCTPIVNLFGRSAEPIRLDRTRTEYRVIPDQHNPMGTEVYSIDSVAAAKPGMEESEVYEPFYSLRHGREDGASPCYWHASRRESLRRQDDGTEVYLSFADLGFRASLPSTEIVSVRVTCTNRDLPSKLIFTGQPGEFNLEYGGPLVVRCLGRPTSPLRPPLRRGQQWRLLSHLSLNHLSIADGDGEPLREILRLYDYSDDPVTRQQIAGVGRVVSESKVAPVATENGVTFCSGLGVEIEFDEDQYVGGGVFLLAAVLERFLGLYGAINSFSQLTARTRQRKEVLKRWKPRSGEQILL